MSHSLVLTISADNRVIRCPSPVGAPPISGRRHKGSHQASSFQRAGDSCLLSTLPAGRRRGNEWIRGRGGPFPLTPAEDPPKETGGLPGKRPDGPKARQIAGLPGGHDTTVPTSLGAGAAPVYRAHCHSAVGRLRASGRWRLRTRQTPTGKRGVPRKLTAHPHPRRVTSPMPGSSYLPAQQPHLLNGEPRDCACAERLASSE